MIFTTAITSADAGTVSAERVALVVGSIAAAFGVLVLVAWQLNRQYINSRQKGDDGRLVGIRQVDATFARLIGLIAIAVLGLLGLGLALAIKSETVAAFYTLLGTIAGYLVGAKTSNTTTTQQETDADGNVVSSKSQDSPQLG
ncbi:hypothetical protein [Kineosporia sp. R_H_3]|uniref:hypothetical protein n=1 Tax=Kineosporia sp. R_H_3 TaxID=1961848 RepID=UPI000B4AB1B6|nr:hypothetical protein [Kineosporia sp. R_H_3]